MSSTPIEDARPRPRQARSRQRVEAICEAALRVLRRSGLAGCHVAAVAAEAGITKASLYRYFPNIDAILLALATRHLDEVSERLDHALTDLTSREHALTVLLDLLEAYEQSFRDDPALRALWAGAITLDSLIDLNVADSRRNGTLIAQRLSPFLTRPLDPTRVFLITHLVGSGVMLMLQVEDAEADRLRHDLRELMLTMLNDGEDAQASRPI